NLRQWVDGLHRRGHTALGTLPVGLSQRDTGNTTVEDSVNLVTRHREIDLRETQDGYCHTHDVTIGIDHWTAGVTRMHTTIDLHFGQHAVFPAQARQDRKS